jgi:membrane associated rhomboid family serine protease
MEQSDKIKFFKSLVFPVVLIALLWIVKAVEIYFRVDFSIYGVQPHLIKGLRGILFSPFLHGDLNHLWANSTPLFILTAGLAFYYPDSWFKILAYAWLATGLWVWSFAEENSTHIGASGVVYALVAFHFTAGLLKREPRQMAFAFLVVFLYGSVIWGIFPELFPDKNISWESHLLGLIAGATLAFFFRENGMLRREHIWNDDDVPDDEDAYWRIPKEKPAEDKPEQTINYTYVEEKKADNLYPEQN